MFSGETGLQWAALAEQLAARWPDWSAGATTGSVSAELPALGVQGCRRAALEALQS